MNILLKVKELIGSGHERTVKAKKNILLAILYKGIGIGVGFAVSPLSLKYLDPTLFGIFIVISGLMDWTADFDMGIGNGMKNKLGGAVAKNDMDEAKAYVSTAYTALTGIFGSLALVFVFASFIIPWYKIVDVDPGMNGEIQLLAVLVFAAFALRFVTTLVYEIFNALQETAKVNAFDAVTKVAFLIIICLLIAFTESSLVLFGAAKSFTFAAIPLIVGIYYFRNSFKAFAPSLKFYRKKHLRALLSLGGMFLLIRIAMIVIYETNAILISNLIDVKAVPLYSEPHKYFSILSTFFVIVTNQLWAAYIEAYEQGDKEWMQSIIKNLVKMWGATVLLGGIMLLLSNFVYYWWINHWLEAEKQLGFSFEVSFFLLISVSVSNWVNVFNLVLNGTSKIRLQMIAMIAAAILNLPLSYLFTVSMDMGLSGIILGTIVSLIPNAVIAPVQVRKIMAGTDTGIWSK
ncbi:MAG: oligosaccharide flippase family protein [Bacteroidota bacterium]